MYERNAIVLERFFDDLFGNNEKNNLKDNFDKYCDLVECSAKYSEATDSEDKIMQEYDDVANRIKNIQKNQEILSNDSVKFQEERDIIFQNIAEEPENIKKMFEELDKKIDENNEEIKKNEQDYIRVITNFIEKSAIRNTLGKERKKVEADYSNALNEILNTHKNINKEKLQSARDFGENINEYERQLLEKIKKNGEGETVPFDNSPVKNAVRLEINIQKKLIDLLCNAYDKTSRLFLEIKNNNTKIDRHRKLIKDTKVRFDFLEGLKAYLISFLDNERLAAVSGEIEHRKQMREACKNFEDDLIQINNMYELLLKEISSKANKKMYRELYNPKYLYNLEKLANEFEEEISKLNLIGTIINPNHWRIEGMKKIYTIFYNSVTEIYGRDLSDFEIDSNKSKNETKDTDIAEKEQDIETKDVKNIFQNIDDYIIKENYENTVDNKEDEETEDEFDEKIDMILGFDKKESNENNNEEDTHENELVQDEIANMSDEDFWKDDEDSESLYKWDDDEDIDNEDFDDWDDNDDFEEDDYDDVQNDQNDEIFDKEEFQDEAYEDIEDSGYVEEDSYDYYGDYDDKEENNEVFIEDYKEVNPWDEEDDEDIKKKKKSSRSIKSSFEKNKKVKGKHDKKENKARGLLGKLRK